jgi:hypothetical protein
MFIPSPERVEEPPWRLSGPTPSLPKEVVAVPGDPRIVMYPPIRRPLDGLVPETGEAWACWVRILRAGATDDEKSNRILAPRKVTGWVLGGDDDAYALISPLDHSGARFPVIEFLGRTMDEALQAAKAYLLSMKETD